MSYQIINVANNKELKSIEDFINSVKFNTLEDHSPLHDPLFKIPGVNFDIVTYGDMPREIVSIFEKYTIAIKDAVTKMTGIQYNTPILGKSYILRYTPGKEISMFCSDDRPDNVFRSIVKWNNSHGGGIFKFKNYKIAKELSPGDCIIFPETVDFTRGFSTVTENSMFISDFWNAPVGQSPYPGLKYEDIHWGNPLWENR